MWQINRHHSHYVSSQHQLRSKHFVLTLVHYNLYTLKRLKHLGLNTQYMENCPWSMENENVLKIHNNSLRTYCTCKCSSSNVLEFLPLSICSHSAHGGHSEDSEVSRWQQMCTCATFDTQIHSPVRRNAHKSPWGKWWKYVQFCFAENNVWIPVVRCIDVRAVSGAEIVTESQSRTRGPEIVSTFALSQTLGRDRVSASTCQHSHWSLF